MISMQVSKVYVIIISVSLILVEALPIINVLQQSPVRYTLCFFRYKTLTQELAATYETNYKACLNTAITAFAKADEETVAKRRNFANATKRACDALKECPGHHAIEEIFMCYANGAYAHIQTMYDIHVNASLALETIREQYFLIKTKQYKCTNATKRAYEKESVQNYVNFNDCILGNRTVKEKTVSLNFNSKGRSFARDDAENERGLSLTNGAASNKPEELGAEPNLSIEGNPDLLVI